jgi:type III secretion protein N (ATPase)
VIASLSRVMDQVTTSEHGAAAARLRALLAAHEAKRDLIALGAYQRGADRAVDEALARIDRIEAFLRPGRDECSEFDATVRALRDVVR